MGSAPTRKHRSAGYLDRYLGRSTRPFTLYADPRMMTFDEIAGQLGCTRQAVTQAYNHALVKLQAHPVALARLMELASELAVERAARLRGQAAARLGG